jgi:DNA-binding IclR family transcriptional regulator
MAILAALADQHGPVTVAELSSLTSLHRASLYRNIESLADEGLVERLPGAPRRYAIGLEFIRIGLRAIRHFELRAALLPTLIDLAGQSREACSLVFYEAGEAVFTDSVYLVDPPIVPVAEGVRTQLHTHGMGKVMLAFQPPSEIDRVLAEPLQRFTDLTVVDPEVLRAELERCRRQGYGTAYGELHVAFGTVGFPILDRRGVSVASLGVRVLRPEGPTSDLIAIGKSVAARASTLAGYRAGLLGAI